MDQLDASADRSRIRLVLTECFDLRLDENPTSGYGCQLDAHGAPAVEVHGDAYEAPVLARAGAAGHHVWRFRAVRVGTVAIELSYRRRGGAPARTFGLAVEVG